jgi:hypothetical protein
LFELLLLALDLCVLFCGALFAGGPLLRLMFFGWDLVVERLCCCDGAGFTLGDVRLVFLLTPTGLDC